MLTDAADTRAPTNFDPGFRKTRARAAPFARMPKIANALPLLHLALSASEQVSATSASAKSHLKR